MELLSFETAPVRVREDLIHCQQRAWRRLMGPGTWLDGQRRVAVAAETRAAPRCKLCQERKAALSPYSVEGTHDGLGELPATMVEGVHRVATDPGRLTEKWYRGLLEAGLTDTEYVEAVGVVGTVVMVDTFARALGMAAPPLPRPAAGEPVRYRPPGAKQNQAWVPTIAPEDATDAEDGLYPYPKGAFVPFIRHTLSLVPDEAKGLFDLVDNHYLSPPQIREFSQDFRAINRPQMELIAARVSALNQCFY